MRFDWGLSGAQSLPNPGEVLVVVDVLSFTTAVSVAVDRNVAVYPAPWRDERAGELAKQEDAALAVGRSQVSPTHPWSLSPAGLLAAPFTPRLVLPSPNGSAIAAAVEGVQVVAASLRNADRVGAWLTSSALPARSPITVIAAGERWPDGSLRPALEDVLGAGAVISALAPGSEVDLSPEAAAARAMYEQTPSVQRAIENCASGIELIRAGFGEDVEVATQVGAGTAVPVLQGQAFLPADR